MSRAKPKPKFCVGEEVMVRGIFTSEYDIDCTEVTFSEYIDMEYLNLVTGKICPPGWRYGVAHVDLEVSGFVEESLRKIPPKDRKSFDDLMAEINNSKVLELAQ